MISLFFGFKRIGMFNSHFVFHMYLVEKGIPHRMDKNGEVDICEADGYWYN